ncbi:MAG: PIN domain nuclease [Candidatus Omnitrophica bacterium CG11_big_fil_rev_8_21_14_0_20_63_9]|nr:MAG: PIN domain nuclease [Candidatus Omnitrophica bacterium CG11_big_fil_rev_8_21_14_0_20_63_9]
MSVVVVDASVAVKWFLPEPHAEAARRVLKGRGPLLAPDLIWAEVGNVLWKKVQRGELAPEAAYAILADFKHFPLQTFAAKALLDAAWELATRLRRSVYDSLYLALAISRNGRLVTADLQFFNALKGGPFATTLTWVERV